MQVTEYEGRKYFRGWAGLELYFEQWLPSGEPRGVVLIVHGYAEHIGRHANTVAWLTGRGYAVYGFDQRGCGRSEGLRGDVVRFGDYVRDLLTYIQYIREREKGKKLFLLGSSTGASAAVLLVAQNPTAVDGLITAAMYVMDVEAYSRAKVVLARILNYFVPALPIQELSPTRISRDPDVVKAYRDDLLVYHGNVRIRMGLHFLRMRRLLEPLFSSIQIPLLVLHGAKDTLSSPQGSILLHQLASSRDKQLKVFEKLHHEILSEPEKEDVLRVITEWLNVKLLP